MRREKGKAVAGHEGQLKPIKRKLDESNDHLLSIDESA